MVKFDPSHALQLPLVRRAFPEVPWIFVYREPVEVLVALGGMPGGRLVPGVLDPCLLGLDALEIPQMPPEEYHARVLARICGCALAHHDRRLARVVDHKDLPGWVWTELPALFGLPCDAQEQGAMRARAGFDAKSPQARFVEDSASKRREASARMREASERWLRASHDALTALRRAQ